MRNKPNDVLEVKTRHLSQPLTLIVRSQIPKLHSPRIRISVNGFVLLIVLNKSVILPAALYASLCYIQHVRT
jgi:hypothetical protein